MYVSILFALLLLSRCRKDLLEVIVLTFETCCSRPCTQKNNKNAKIIVKKSTGLFLWTHCIYVIYQ